MPVCARGSPRGDRVQYAQASRRGPRRATASGGRCSLPRVSIHSGGTTTVVAKAYPHQQSEMVPAIVVGGSLNALGVVRSLTSGGVPTILLETTDRCPGRWSRHCRFVRVKSLDGRALIDELKALSALSGQSGQRPVLI